jgi:fused signal recognition particle receptor
MIFRKSGNGLFGRLARTRDRFAQGLSNLLAGSRVRVDDALLEQIEDQLIMADVGVEASTAIVGRLREGVRRGRINDAESLREAMRDEVASALEPAAAPLRIGPERPFVVLMVGVNGVGKTTTAAKLAGRLKSEGHTVMLAACDTFRAAAIEQLKVWGERLEVPVIAQQHGADAAAVAHDAMAAARARAIDVLIIDSAGRQHVNADLMEQLRKVRRVLSRLDPDAPHEVLLTVDAGTGQNALSQVARFHEAVGLTGLCVTKLDGTARGGVVIAIADRFRLPIRFLGVGEQLDDLDDFRPADFAAALIPGS